MKGVYESLQYTESYNIQFYTKIFWHKLLCKKISFQGSDSEKEPKKNKLKECLIDICIGWVAWDVIKELYHYFSNRGKPPLP